MLTLYIASWLYCYIVACKPVYIAGWRACDNKKTAPVRARLYRLRSVADGAFTAALAPLRAGLRKTCAVRNQHFAVIPSGAD